MLFKAVSLRATERHLGSSHKNFLSNSVNVTTFLQKLLFVYDKTVFTVMQSPSPQIIVALRSFICIHDCVICTNGSNLVIPSFSFYRATTC